MFEPLAVVATTAPRDSHPCRRRQGPFDRDPPRQATRSAPRPDFEHHLDGYDLVPGSLGRENLEKYLRVLKPGGKAIGIAGPPNPAFARAASLNPLMPLAVAGLSGKFRKRAKELGKVYEFPFMHADGDHLRQITAGVDQGMIHPAEWAVPGFDQVPQAP